LLSKLFKRRITNPGFKKNHQGHQNDGI
jgi:hypothetical protein